MKPLLPPQQVAAIDQATAAATTRIDVLLDTYVKGRRLGHTEAEVMTAMAQQLSGQLDEHDRRTVQGHMIDMLIVAISRLAPKV